MGKELEVPGRIELPHKGFADLSLTTWARHHSLRDKESGRRDSNSRHFAWEANALPLNYSRICASEYIIALPCEFVNRRTPTG